MRERVIIFSIRSTHHSLIRNDTGFSRFTSHFSLKTYRPYCIISYVIAQKKPLIAEWVVFCILMVSFSVYYLGVYMFLGLMNLFIFSVSTTLKSYVIIMPYNILNVNRRK